ncbi:MAG TPA: M20 family metallopeptidase [Fastidiosipila sp.]|nr:M20 family metallopeptidase [Fastidiosipila sp.]
MDTKNDETIIHLVQDLVRMKSDNPGEEESVVQLHLRDLLSEYGVQTDLVETATGRLSLLARIEGRRSGGGLMLAGHADVVPVSNEEFPAWRYAPYGGEIENKKLFGRGSSDMKGGLAAGLLAFLDFFRNNVEPEVDLLFVSTADEEDRMTGSRSLLDHPWLDSIDHALIMEPTDLKIATEGFGRTFGQVICRGEKAHGAVSGVGHNAISIAMELLSRMNEIDLGLKIDAAESFWQPLEIRAGVKPGIVPDRCDLVIDARIAYPADPEAVWSVLAELGKDLSIEITPEDLRRPWRAEPDDKLLSVLTNVCGKHDIAPTQMIFRGSTDGNIFLERGIAPIIFGPGSLALAHRANEYVEIGALKKAKAVYRDVIDQFALP